MSDTDDIKDFASRALFALVFIIVIGVALLPLLLNVATTNSQGAGDATNLVLLAPVAFAMAAFLIVWKHYVD